MRARDHLLFTGKPQAGKTTLVRQLLAGTPRWVALDPEGDYADLPGVVEAPAWAPLGGDGDGPDAPTYAREEIRRLADPDAEVRLSLTADRPADHLALAAALFRLQDAYELPTVCLVMEEAWQIAPGQHLPRELKRIFFAGTKRGIWAAVVTQNAQQIPKQIRQAAGSRIYLRLVADPPADMARQLPDDAADRLPELEILTPEDTPEKGRHYLTDPPGLELEEVWSAQIEGKRG